MNLEEKMKAAAVKRLTSPDLYGNQREAKVVPLDTALSILAEAEGGLRGSMDGHPEDYCHRCGGRNITWYADSGLWNQLNPPESIICPICFVIEAESKGVKTTAWRVAPEDVSDEKQRLFVRLHEGRDRIHDLEAAMKPTVGSWPWALEQMKAGNVVERASEPASAIVCDLEARRRGFSDIYGYIWEGGPKLAQLSSIDFEATDWRIVEEPETQP